MKEALLRPSVYLLIALCVMIINPANSAKITVQQNPTTGLRSWTAESDGFSLELIQVLPDFIRAIYAAHEFPADEVEDIASYCVFGSVIKNTSGKTLEYNVANWYYTDNKGNQHKVKTKTEWLAQWEKAGVTFSWTLLPDKGTFYVGDWQQGFTTVKLPRESNFDFTFKWRIDGKQYTDTIEDMSCAPASLDL